MPFLDWLQHLGRTAAPAAPGFQAQPLYLLMAVLLPVGIGLTVGYGVRLLERLLGRGPARGGGH